MEQMKRGGLRVRGLAAAEIRSNQIAAAEHSNCGDLGERRGDIRIWDFSDWDWDFGIKVENNGSMGSMGALRAWRGGCLGVSINTYTGTRTGTGTNLR